MVRIGSDHGTPLPPSSREPEGTSSFQLSEAKKTRESGSPRTASDPTPKEQVNAAIKKMEDLYAKLLEKLKHSHGKISIEDFEEMNRCFDELYNDFAKADFIKGGARTIFDKGINLLRSSLGEFFTQKDHPNTYSENMLINFNLAIQDFKEARDNM